MEKSKTYLFLILLISFLVFFGLNIPCLGITLNNKFFSGDTTQKTPKFHIIKGSETLAILSARYKIPQNDLMKWNKLISHKVSPNQKILLYDPEGGDGKNKANVSAEELQALLNKMNYQPTVIAKKGTEIKIIQEQPFPSLIKDERRKEKAKADSAFKTREMEEKLEQMKKRSRADSLARIKAEREKKKTEMTRIKKEKMRADSLAKAEAEKQRIAALEKVRADSMAQAEEERRIKAAREKAIADSLSRVKTEEDKKRKIREKFIADSIAKIKTIQKKDSLERLKIEQEKIRKETEAKLSAANQNQKQTGKPTTKETNPEKPFAKDGRENISADDVTALLSKLNVKTEQKVQYTQQLGIQVSGEDDLNNDQLIRFAFFYDKDLIRTEEREFHSYVVGTKESYKIEEKKDTAIIIKREESQPDKEVEKKTESGHDSFPKSKKGTAENGNENLSTRKDKSQKESSQTETKAPPLKNDTTSSDAHSGLKPGNAKTTYGEIEEKGIAYVLFGKEIEQNGLKIIHPTAPVGTTVKITNPFVDKSVFAKVCSNELAKIPEKDVIVQMNKKVSDKLGLKNKFVFVNLTYMGYR